VPVVTPSLSLHAIGAVPGGHAPAYTASRASKPRGVVPEVENATAPLDGATHRRNTSRWIGPPRLEPLSHPMNDCASTLVVAPDVLNANGPGPLIKVAPAHSSLGVVTVTRTTAEP